MLNMVMILYPLPYKNADFHTQGWVHVNKAVKIQLTCKLGN